MFALLRGNALIRVNTGGVWLFPLTSRSHWGGCDGGSGGVVMETAGPQVSPFTSTGLEFHRLRSRRTRRRGSTGVSRPVGSFLCSDWPGGQVTLPWKRFILDVSAPCSDLQIPELSSAPAAVLQEAPRVRNQSRHPNQRQGSPIRVPVVVG